MTVLRLPLMIGHVKTDNQGSAVSVIGAGAAGLFATAELVRAGRAVTLFEQKTVAASKLRLAGSSGLNLTNTLSPQKFAERYGSHAELFRTLLAELSPERIIEWAESLGAQTFQGSGGKILTKDGDGSALIDGLVNFLRNSPLVTFRFGCRFSGFSENGDVLLETGGGLTITAERPVILALGGASWPLTGSDGKWMQNFTAAGIAVTPFRPANCGFYTVLSEGETGERIPVKNLGVIFQGQTVRGDIMLTGTGIEGSPVYAHASALVKKLDNNGPGAPQDIQTLVSGTVGMSPAEGSPNQTEGLLLDLCPDLDSAEVEKRLRGNRGKASVSTFVRKQLHMGPGHGILIRRALGREGFAKLIENPALVKALPLPCLAPRPIEEAISVSGGLPFTELDEHFMLKKFPRIFCAGEMLDWDAPTGGFLLTGCFATAHRAIARILDTE